MWVWVRVLVYVYVYACVLATGQTNIRRLGGHSSEDDTLADPF